MNNSKLAKTSKAYLDNPRAFSSASFFGITSKLIKVFDPTKIQENLSGGITTLGRYITASHQNRLYEEFDKDILDLIKSGGYKEERFHDKKITDMYITNLMEIETNHNESEKLDVIKKLLLYALSNKTLDSEVILIHEIFQRAKNLKTIDIYVLNSCYIKYLEKIIKFEQIVTNTDWLNTFQEFSGEGTIQIIFKSSEHLVDLDLLHELKGDRVHSPQTMRLTYLGLKLFEILKKHED